MGSNMVRVNKIAASCKEWMGGPGGWICIFLCLHVFSISVGWNLYNTT